MLAIQAYLHIFVSFQEVCYLSVNRCCLRVFRETIAHNWALSKPGQAIESNQYFSREPTLPWITIISKDRTVAANWKEFA